MTDLIDKHLKKGMIQPASIGLPPGAKEGVEWARHFYRRTCRVSYSGIKTGSTQQQGPE